MARRNIYLSDDLDREAWPAVAVGTAADKVPVHRIDLRGDVEHRHLNRPFRAYVKARTRGGHRWDKTASSDGACSRAVNSPRQRLGPLAVLM
jgi:hypothetical protein